LIGRTGEKRNRVPRWKKNDGIASSLSRHEERLVLSRGKKLYREWQNEPSRVPVE
jgi:hypothetical protein